MRGDRALHLVLDLRKKEEQEALELYISARNKEQNYRVQIDRIKEFRQSYILEMQEKGKIGFNTNSMLAYHDFLNKLDSIEQRQQQELILCEQDTKRKYDFYLQRQQRRKIIETLIEKHRLERIKATNKAEQKLLDDFVVSHSGRGNDSDFD